MNVGDAYWWDNHVWFILSDPKHPSGKVLCVNLTTLDDDCIDDECILDHQDYAWINNNHPTAVAFTRSRIYDVKKIEKAFRENLLQRPHPDKIPQSTIKKIRSIALGSRDLGKDKRSYLL